MSNPTEKAPSAPDGEGASKTATSTTPSAKTPTGTTPSTSTSNPSVSAKADDSNRRQEPPPGPSGSGGGGKGGKAQHKTSGAVGESLADKPKPMTLCGRTWPKFNQVISEICSKSSDLKGEDWQNTCSNLAENVRQGIATARKAKTIQDKVDARGIAFKDRLRKSLSALKKKGKTWDNDQILKQATLVWNAYVQYRVTASVTMMGIAFSSLKFSPGSIQKYSDSLSDRIAQMDREIDDYATFLEPYFQYDDNGFIAKVPRGRPKKGIESTTDHQTESDEDTHDFERTVIHQLNSATRNSQEQLEVEESGREVTDGGEEDDDGLDGGQDGGGDFVDTEEGELAMSGRPLSSYKHFSEDVLTKKGFASTGKGHLPGLRPSSRRHEGVSQKKSRKEEKRDKRSRSRSPKRSKKKESKEDRRNRKMGSRSGSTSSPSSSSSSSSRSSSRSRKTDRSGRRKKRSQKKKKRKDSSPGTSPSSPSSRSSSSSSSTSSSSSASSSRSRTRKKKKRRKRKSSSAETETRRRHSKSKSRSYGLSPARKKIEMPSDEAFEGYRPFRPCEPTVDVQAESLNNPMYVILKNQFDVTKHFPFRYDGKNMIFHEFKYQWMDLDLHLANLNFTKGQRLRELKKVVKGTVYTAIKGYSNENAFYSLALQQIERTFSDKREHLIKIIGQLFEFKQVETGSEHYLKAHAAFSSVIASIQGLKLRSRHIFLILQLIALEKIFDPWLRDNYGKWLQSKRSDKAPIGYSIDINDAMLKFEQLAKHYQRVHESQRGDRKPEKKQSPATPKVSYKLITSGNSKKSFKPSLPKNFNIQAIEYSKEPKVVTIAPTGMAKPQNAGKRERQFCAFCQNQISHTFPLQCPKLKKASKVHIHKVAREKNLCRNCLGQGHSQKDCPAGPRIHCPKKGCNSRHAVYFHPGYTDRPKSAVITSSVDQE